MKRIISTLLIITCTLSLFACGKKADGTAPSEDYEAAVSAFCNFLVYDIKDIRGFATEDFWKYMKDNEGFDVDGEKEAANVALYIEKNRESTEALYGTNVKVSYKIVEDKYLNELTIEAKREYFKENYGISPERILEVKRVSVEFTIKGSNKETSNTVDILPVNIDGKWYPCSTTGYFYIHPYASAAMAY